MAVRSRGGCCSVLGTAFFAGSLSEGADLVIERALSGEGGYATLTGVHGVTLANDDNLVRAALDGAWMNFPDGAPVAWYQRRLGMVGAERVGGPDLMPLVIDRGRRVDLRHFLFGSTPEVLELLERQIGRLYPSALVVGSHSPPFRPLEEDEERGIASRILATDPHIVWVGLGAPKQDTWCHANAHRVSPALCVGVGAAVDAAVRPGVVAPPCVGASEARTPLPPCEHSFRAAHGAVAQGGSPGARTMIAGLVVFSLV